MKNIYSLLTIAALCSMALLSSCDTDGEENFTWRPGDNLRITGSNEIYTLQEESYYVEGFTVDETYQWNLSGPSEGQLEVIREGEFANVSADVPGTYTLTVSNGTYDGSLTIEVTGVEQFAGFETDSLYTMENVDTLRIPVTISGRNPTESEIAFTVTSGTAVDGTDFEVLTASPLVVDEITTDAEAGAVTTFIEILITNNIMLNEDALYFDVTLDEVTSIGEGEYGIGINEESNTTRVFIEDDLKFIAFENAQTDTLTNASEAGVYTFDVAITDVSTEETTINYSIAGVGVVDVSATPGIVVLTAGQESAEIAVRLDAIAFQDNQEIVITLEQIQTLDQEISFMEEDGDTTDNVKIILIDVE